MGHLTGVNLGIIRYANCWEDARLLLHALSRKPAQRIAIVASAGDNALALLAHAPEQVVAFDISAPQLHLTELKREAFTHLSYDELLAFLGVLPASAVERIRLYQRLAPHLSTGAKAFWQQHSQQLKNGAIHSGKFERYFRIFRRYFLPLVHSRKTVSELLCPKSEAAQQAFFQKRWNSLRWRMLMGFFFSRWVMGRAGRDPRFLEQVKIPVPQYIRQKAEAHLQSPAATTNPFLHYIFTGNFGKTLPEYLRPENHAAIRQNLHRLEIRQIAAEELLAEASFDTLCLSNIFEYFPEKVFADTVAQWQAQLASGTRLLFWNLMAPRSFSRQSPDFFQLLPQPDAPVDNGFFYSAFLAEVKR